VAIAICVPIAAAAASPLLAWRQPVYIIAGFAGIAAMALLLLQPLLAAGLLPGLTRSARAPHPPLDRRLRLFGLVVGHVGGLWVTSPPDVIDALTFSSPTPFSAWGVIAMWALFGAARPGRVPAPVSSYSATASPSWSTTSTLQRTSP
jgi:hypothetical protein